MNKKDFLLELEKALTGLPQEDINGRIEFYSEIIDDLTEDGLTEQQATEQLGNVDDIANQILLEIPLTKLVKAKIKPRRSLRTWEIVLLAAGSPIWLSLIIAAFAVVLSVYASLWAVVISLYSTLSIAGVAVAGVALAVISAVAGNVPAAILFIGASLLCGGLTILMLLASNQVTRGVIALGKLILIGIKRCFVRKESVK